MKVIGEGAPAVGARFGLSEPDVSVVKSLGCRRGAVQSFTPLYADVFAEPESWSRNC